MNRIYTFGLLLILSAACTNNDSEREQQNQSPTNNNLTNVNSTNKNTNQSNRNNNSNQNTNDSNSNTNSNNIPDGQFALQINGVGTATVTHCLAWNGNAWSTKATSFKNGDGPIVDRDCLLAPAKIDYNNELDWVSGNSFDVALYTPSADNDPVRHSVSTAEDIITSGEFEMKIFDRDGYFDQMPLTKWEGQLTVHSINLELGIVYISVNGQNTNNPPTTPDYILNINGVGTSISTECLSWDGKSWSVHTTYFTNTDGPIEDESCILAPAFIASESTTYWVSGNLYDLTLATPDADGDSVRHSVSTSEDAIESGTFRLKIYIRDGRSTEPVLWAGRITIFPIDITQGTVGISLQGTWNDLPGCDINPTGAACSCSQAVSYSNTCFGTDYETYYNRCYLHLAPKPIECQASYAEFVRCFSKLSCPGLGACESERQAMETACGTDSFF